MKKGKFSKETRIWVGRTGQFKDFFWKSNKLYIHNNISFKTAISQDFLNFFPPSSITQFAQFKLVA
uniref:Uncharacterized protein n=1 Tax=Octopus bimaculoides TaxID=37653 RepID=A0A0L8GML0_OCTBM